ncbi:hypothetical protein TWF696_003912 [Orbilia brochopaga]|uniref:Uncharacterized protein n=1 Tax=Orbilia brochopaga TaxID=3140254 RepID=A0AAV9V4H8_9PEZI
MVKAATFTARISRFPSINLLSDRIRTYPAHLLPRRQLNIANRAPFYIYTGNMRGNPEHTVMMDYVPTAQYTREDQKANKNDLAELCRKHIEAHVKSAELYHSQLAQILNPTSSDNVPALTTIAINSMINSLRQDPSASNFETVMKHTPDALLNSIIGSHKLHYTSMLRFTEQKGWDKFKDDSRRDLWILKNEYYIRADGTEWGLLNLDDADIVFKHCSEVVKNNDGEPIHRLITRKIAPKSGLQYLDQKRPRTLKIQPSTQAYQKAFNRLMGGALDGLDWNNVFVAGGMALSALLCVDESMDKEYESNDIDMYIYGLTPEHANEKVKHIAEVWKKNLNPGEDFVMVKNAKTITLIGSYPRRRVQIILKMIKTPAAVLLNFDLDQVAIGYTGETVLFLPRFARAIETGYSIFTLDMIHGHHLNDRRETQEERLLKYAQRGFGVRILPEFCEMVEIDFGKRRHTEPFLEQARGDMTQHGGSLWSQGRPKSKKDVISGVKAVRRVFAAGEDMVHRFYLGRTEVSKPEDYDEEEYFYEESSQSRSDWGFTEITDETGQKRKVPSALFSSIDTHRSTTGAPHGRRGLGSLEMHARHCALFRFEQEGKMTVDYNSLASTTYDNETYDMMPKYKWDVGFKPTTFMRAIDSYNEDLFQRFCEALESDPAIEEGMNGPQPPPNNPGSYVYRRPLPSNWKTHLKGYLTRRIRRIAYSKDINELVDRFQIVVPVAVDFGLENWIKDTFAQALEEAGIPSSSHEILIPVHKPGMGDGYLPDVSESVEDNLRYWVIDSTTIWAGIDRRIDEIFEVLWILSVCNEVITDCTFGYQSRQESRVEFYELVASLLLRRVTRLSIQQLGVERVPGAKHPDTSGPDPRYEIIEAPVSTEPDQLVIPNQRDQYLFTKWLMERPVSIYRGYQYEIHQSYRESNNDIAPPEIMYLREGVDYTSDEWTEWPEGAPGFEPIATFRPQPGRPARSDGRSNSDDDWADNLPDDDDDDDEDDGDAKPQPGLKRRGSALAGGEEDAAPDDDDDDVDAEGEYAGPGPRGAKRRREKTDLTDMAAGLDDPVDPKDDDDTSMADAPSGTS